MCSEEEEKQSGKIQACSGLGLQLCLHSLLCNNLSSCRICLLCLLGAGRMSLALFTQSSMEKGEGVLSGTAKCSGFKAERNLWKMLKGWAEVLLFSCAFLLKKWDWQKKAITREGLDIEQDIHVEELNSSLKVSGISFLLLRRTAAS